MDRDEVGHDDVGHPESPNEQPRLGLYNIDDHLIINDQKNTTKSEWYDFDLKIRT